MYTFLNFIKVCFHYCAFHIESFIKWIDVDKTKANNTSLLYISAPFFIFSSKSFLFKSTSTTLKSSMQAEFPFIRSILSSLDIWRLAPIQHSMSMIFDLSSICSTMTIALSVLGSCSWRRVKLCCMR